MGAILRYLDLNAFSTNIAIMRAGNHGISHVNWGSPTLEVLRSQEKLWPLRLAHDTYNLQQSYNYTI